MLDIEDQLAALRRRIASIDRKYQSEKRPIVARRPARDLEHSFIEEWAPGCVIANERGTHYQMERLYPRHKLHGSADIGSLADLPPEILDVLSDRKIASVPPERWAFLDTETTGLMGTPGIYAFLIGVGRITRDGFVVRQYFMREYREEASMLLALAEHLTAFDVLITYNGRSYDEPLLETRFGLHRIQQPFTRLPHLDVLYGARRLWKLGFQNCRLMQLEQEVLGLCREGDLPGELIPYVYFEYLRSHQAQRLVPIFHHNARDIVTLACLTAIVSAAFRTTDCESLTRLGIRRGTELAGIGRWLRAAGEAEQSITLLRRAIDAGLPDGLLFRTLWDVGCLEKKLARLEAAKDVFSELASCRNPYRAAAIEELAKHCERESGDIEQALVWTRQAIELSPSEALTRRKERLERRLAKLQQPAKKKRRSTIAIRESFSARRGSNASRSLREL